MGAIAGGLWWDRQALAACEDQRGWVEDAWSPQLRGAIEEAFAAVEQPYAAKARDRALAELDRYAGELAQRRGELCTAEHRGQITPELFAARNACLDERHERLGAVAQRLAEADETLVEHTADVLGALPTIEPCATVERYAPTVDSDPEERRAIERALFEAQLIAAAGRQPEALALLDPLIERARALDDPHTLGLALVRSGELVGSARDLERSEALLSEAAMLAERTDDHDLAIDALCGLAHTLHDMRGRWDDAQRVLDFAKAKYARRPGGSAGEWRLHYVQSGIYGQYSRKDEAIAELELAVAGARSQPPMTQAKTLHALSFAEARAGRLEQAEAHARESIELRIGVYGPEHPSLMYPMRALASIAADRGRPEEALELLDRALAMGRASHGRDAAGLIEPHEEKAKVLRKMGRYQDALAEYDESVRLHQVNHKSAEEVLRLQSQVLLRLGRAEEALARAEEALAAHREQLGDDERVPWLRARFVMHRGEAFLALGRHDEALRDFQRAAELRALEKADGLLLRIWADEGECLLAMGDQAGARAILERARAHREAGNEDGR
ncbi:MAG: tetratricopeptide repeat protein, partial [Myxococcales bacterium]|nr:tetratricopeptide repeat protein [Myxococcales bacterium]